MKTRGRDSAAALAVVKPGNVETLRRPQPPRSLTPDEAHEWAAIVNELPADYFRRENLPLLEAYVFHVCNRRLIAKHYQTRLAAGAETDELDQVSKMHERESRSVSSLATRMRLTQHSNYDKTRKKPSNAPATWSKEQELAD